MAATHTLTITPHIRAALQDAAFLTPDQLRPYYLTPDIGCLELVATPAHLAYFLRIAPRILAQTVPARTLGEIMTALADHSRSDDSTATLFHRLRWS